MKRQATKNKDSLEGYEDVEGRIFKMQLVHILLNY
jgi:hypothetical protein